MNDIDLMRIKGEHERTREKLGNPRCSWCGEPTISSTIEKNCNYKGRWGGTVGGGKELVPVWKCPNGHITHHVMMG